MIHPVYLTVVVWAALLLLALLVILMYRQLGRVFAATDEGAERPGPALGTSGEAFEYLRVNDETTHSFVPGNGEPALLAFADPTCPACEALVESLSTAEAAGEFAGLRVLIVMSDPPEYREVSDAFRTTRLEIARPLTASARDAYRAFATPLLVALDPGGTVRAARAIADPKEVRRFRQTAMSWSAGGSVPLGDASAEASEERLSAAHAESIVLRPRGDGR